VDDERPDPGARRVSRRAILKRLGAGAAVAWTAPVVLSMKVPAFAASPAGCVDCAGTGCGDNPSCGPNGDCFLQCRADGSECVCLSPNGFCFGCASDADCAQFGSGYVCTQSCICATTGCAAPCGSSAPYRRGLQRYALRSS
jgi:hypothetical protein